MRADRLISLLMLLQSRGQMTAEDLAAELEVSVRTIYRDLEALSTAGIPIYTERGVGGGCSLLEEYRTSLAALTEAEARSLFLLSIPEPLANLGLGGMLKSAYMKLYAALPGLRQGQEAGSRRIHLDWTDWRQHPASPHLMAVYRAIAENHSLSIRYALSNGRLIDQTVDPYGLVAKAGAWYLVISAHGKLSWLRLAEIRDLEVLAQTFDLPDGFDLAGYWQGVCTEVEQGALSFRVLVRADPAVIPYLTGQPQARLAGLLPDAHGWEELELYFESFESARERLLGLGRAVEILEPETLRRSVVDIAAQIAGLYAGRNQI